MREQEIQKEILHWLNTQYDIFAWRCNSTGIFDGKGYRKQGGFNIRGVSDILAILSPSGKLLAIEVKTDTGKLSTEQFAFIAKINKMGGQAAVCRSLSDAQVFIDNVRRG